MKVEDVVVRPGGQLSFLKVTLDNKLTYYDHISKGCGRAVDVTVSPNTLMTNVRGSDLQDKSIICITLWR